MSINEEVVIDSTDAPNYNSWQTNVYGDGADNVQIKYKLYFFEVQNLEETVSGQKPVVVQLGPYAYDEYYVKFDIVWTDHGDTISYNTQKYYIFNEAETAPGLSKDDDITLPYPTVIAFQYLLGQVTDAQEQILDQIIDGKLQAKEQALEGSIQMIYAGIQASNLTAFQKRAADAKLASATATMETLFTDLYSFTNQSDAGDVVLKTLLCGGPNGFSPFWKVNQFDAWFGWLNDPVLVEVTHLLAAVSNKTGSAPMPFNTGVAGASTNWTSIADTRRRRAPDTLKTGKKNVNQVGQFVKYTNMTQLWTCVSAFDSQNLTDFDPTTQFAACEYFHTDWTDKQAEAAGYVKPFGSAFANRIEGTDGNMFGRPVTSEKIQIFVFDIYRSLFLEHTEDVDWSGVTLRRYQLQDRDLQNSTTYPTNAQYYQFGPNGVENTTAATGVPIFVSFPHFLNADPSLQAAIVGLNPSQAEHTTYLDIEPQSGLLARAHKRLQVNYEMTSKTFPTTSPDAIAQAHSVCNDISDALTLLNQTDITHLDCDLTLFDELLTCLGAPAGWEMYQDKVYFPYGWADEGFVLPDSDAEDISNSLYLIDDIASAFRFWCVIVAIGCFIGISAMLCRGYLDRRKSFEQSVLGAGSHHGSATASYKARRSAGSTNAMGMGMESALNPLSGASEHGGQGDEDLLLQRAEPLLFSSPVANNNSKHNSSSSGEKQRTQSDSDRSFSIL